MPQPRVIPSLGVVSVNNQHPAAQVRKVRIRVRLCLWFWAIVIHSVARHGEQRHEVEAS